uniref:Portal protein n=1 Tax=viral metagenome TaxID=1070528 RepID=A0A6M3J4P5_9ZZZZ
MAKTYKVLKPADAEFELFTTVAEITTVIDEKEQDLAILRNQMDDDFDLLTLAPSTAEEGYNVYTSPAPGNYFDKVQDGVNRSEISINIKLSATATDEEKEKAQLGEKFIWGALDQIDRHFRRIGEPSLRKQISWYGCARGRVNLRALVLARKSKGGKPEAKFDAVVWDPLHTFFEVGEDGLVWIANKRRLTKAQIWAKFGIKTKGKDAMVIDFYDQKNNSIIIDNNFAKEPTKHGLDHVPGYFGAVGSMPTVTYMDHEPTHEHRGDSVFNRARGVYAPRNQMMGRLMDIADRSVVGSIVHKSRDGKKALPDGIDPFRTFQEITIDKDESIEPLKVPGAPEITGTIFSILEGDLSQSTLPYPLSYGGTKQAMSGAALGVLVEGTRSVYSPRTHVLEQSYVWLIEELFSQYKAKGVTTTMRGYDFTGDYFSVEITPDDIDLDWYVVVNAEPKLPRDRGEEIQMALMATEKRNPGSQPLMTYDTAREDILQLRDPAAEKDKIYIQQAESLEPILIAKIVAALKKAGKPDLAEEVLMLLKPPGTAPKPQVPTELLQAAVEALAQNPETQPLAEAIVKSMQPAPSGPPPGTPQGGPPGEPPGAPPVTQQPQQPAM